jgi:predicted nucleic acid-binding protein
MAVALLDTNVLFASASARDEYHDRAREIVAGIDHGDLPDTVVTNYVVAETLNLCRERLGPDLSDELLDRLVEGSHFELVHTPRADFTEGQRLFRQYSRLSFVDATLVAYADRNDVEFLYSFDDDFDGVDEITRMSAAENPYR